MQSFHLHTTDFPGEISRLLNLLSLLMFTVNCRERLFGFITMAASLFMLSAAGEGSEMIVRSDQELRAALVDLKASSTIKIAPGVYKGGLSVREVERLTIVGLDPNNPPHFQGGVNAWHFSLCERLTVQHIRISGQSGNGLNIDDGGGTHSPVRNLSIENVEVSDIGPKGNHDGIKCSGLQAFTIKNCVIQGWGGQGIDCVGCHDGLITDCSFTGKADFSATAAVQLKGGTSSVIVEKCRFVKAGDRPLNIGGSTDLEYFRPRDAKHEASRIVVRSNQIEGGPCAAAFVGVDGAEFYNNTILYPEKWVFRILQENRSEGFVACRNVVIKDNQIVFRRAQVQIDINIGPDTDPSSFRFEGNRWFAEDRPQASKPRLPVDETNATWGQDPRTQSR